MTTERNFHFIVPVWGRVYTKLFVDICLPMIMTSGNLGALEKSREDRFVIVTTWEDAQTIRGSSNYERLGELVRVEFILIDGLVDTGNSHAAMSECYAMAMRHEGVIPGETYFVFLTPDSFWSDGTFQRLIDLAAQGFQVVMAAGLRVQSEAMSLMLREEINKSPDNPTIPLARLVRMILGNIHQLSSAHNWLSKSGFLNVWPSHIYWINERDQQLIAHCFHLHPLMVLAPNANAAIGTTIDGEFLDNLRYPLDRYYVSQGEFIGVELSPAERNWGQPLGAPLLHQVIRFSLFHANSRHWHFFDKRIILNGDPTKPIAPGLEKFIDTIVGKIQRNRNLAMRIQKFRLHRYANRIGRIKSVRLKNLARRWLIR